jgi:hypothetical protein
MIWKMGFLRNMKFRHVSKREIEGDTEIDRERIKNSRKELERQIKEDYLIKKSTIQKRCRHLSQIDK